MDFQVGVRRIVGHDSAGSDHPVEARGKDDIARRQVALIVARGGHDEHPGVVQRVDRVGPGLRRQAAHAHGDDVNLRRRVGAQAVHVVERAGNGAVVDERDAVGDPDGYHFDERRGTNGN